MLLSKTACSLRMVLPGVSSSTALHLVSRSLICRLAVTLCWGEADACAQVYKADIYIF